MRNRISGHRIGLILALGLFLILTGWIAGCKEDAATITASAPQAGDSSVVVQTVDAVTTEFEEISVDIPDGAVSIAIIVKKGANENLKFVDHGQLVLDNSGNTSFFITGPDGDAPLSFNQEDADGDGVDDGVFIDVLANYEAEALFFPNDGSTASFSGGTWTFPIGSLNACLTESTCDFEEDTLQVYVLYKTSANSGQTLDVNLFVVSGVSSDITTSAEALADPEISGAITLLENVYQNNSDLNLNLNINLEIIEDTSFISIDSTVEQDTMLKSYPTNLTSDALNLFIIGELAYLPSGVIGLSAGIPGPFNLHGTIVSGTLAEYQGDGTGTTLGYILAHEFGHFLGLWHTSQTDGSTVVAHDPISDTGSCTTALVQVGISSCPDSDNLMFPFLNDTTDPPITAGQAQVILNNPAIY